MYQELLIVSRLPRVQLRLGSGITVVLVDWPDDAENPFLYLFERSVSFRVAHGVRYRPCAKTRRGYREQDESNREEEESLQERQRKPREAEYDEGDGGYDDENPFELFVHMILQNHVA